MQFNYDYTVQKEKSTQKLILFLGFQHDTFDQFYSHFIDKKCLQDNAFFKIILISKKQNQQSCFLINSPYSLKKCTDFDQDLDQKIMLFSSKINLEQILDNFHEYKVHLVVNGKELLGNDQQEILQNFIDKQLLQFGKIQLKKQYISIIFQEKVNTFSLIIVKDLKSLNLIDLQFLSIELILNTIFKNVSFFEFKISQNPIEVNYGEMSCHMMRQQEKLLKIVNNKIEKLWIQLLNLQQIPKIDECYGLQLSLGKYLEQLNGILNLYLKPKLSVLWKIIYKINQITMTFGNAINKELVKLNQSPQLEQFLKIKNIEFKDLSIKTQLFDINQLKDVNEFFTKYHKYEYDNVILVSIQNFAIIVDFWNKYFKNNLVHKLFQLNQIGKNVQTLPQQDYETGVFLFGKSRVGKSTLINLIQNPQSLTIKKEINEQCYVLKEGIKTQFKIDHGCMSETQAISGMEIDGVWYFDCPGFDDNLSEYNRIAHRINLYNYLKKAKKVIGFLVVDGSIKDAQIIKDTINPLYELMEDKNQLLQEHEKWLSLILVKIKKNARENCIKYWEQAYRGQLDGNYSIFRQMYENNNQCVEFYKAKKKFLNDGEQFEKLKNNTRQKIIDIVQRQLQNKEFKVQFQLMMENKLFYLVQDGIAMLIIKVQHIMLIFKNQFNHYILENQSDVSQKQKIIKQLEPILKEDINQNNLDVTLLKLQRWCQQLIGHEISFFFLDQLISDATSYLKILFYTKNSNIAPFNINTEIIRKNLEIAIDIINQIETSDQNLIRIGMISLIHVVSSVQQLLFESVLINQGQMSVEQRVDKFKNRVLKLKYELHLESQARNERI
ncbi:unnamed protein product (macronuclear) [Paramecium tetraurelia]|uniref:G domain-containing protein n=1 Tax=Paramecium tetraurelia TaxID=5888 RepID=A0E2F2_PARTE|nr:uncharacterized protein GSPATT00022641001 [Paramecium tetraurelia]CAK89469.1 unnamed protein product [Paramecium tetraurelia]|eukprot:XP_001456866.1 hypothetical protein (macronuclear) [Paramecium tetraurelia strain d4-2]